MYRKKPVVIEAVQLIGENFAEVIGFCPDAVYHTNPPEIVIPTLGGNMIASPGDFIIRGVRGEYYPCKPDIFEATYDLVE